MLSIEQLRLVDSTLKNLTDEELEEIRKELYDLGQLIWDDWLEEKINRK